MADLERLLYVIGRIFIKESIVAADFKSLIGSFWVQNLSVF